MGNRLSEIILNTDDAILALVQEYGMITYLILFLIVYAETGLLVFPFLPGDGLLFAIGVISGLGYLEIGWILLLLIIAATLGNYTSFAFGRYGQGLFKESKNERVKVYLQHSQRFYDSHGGNAVIFARFLPVLRTYVPLMAGLSNMHRQKFGINSLVGAVAWVLLFTLLGYFLGSIPWVEENYGFIFLSLIIITILPLPVRYLMKIVRH